MEVVDDADDGGPLARLAFIADFDLLTEGVLVEEGGADESLVDEKSDGSIGSVGGVEEAAGDEANAHGVEIAGGGGADLGVGLMLVRRRRGAI